MPATDASATPWVIAGQSRTADLIRALRQDAAARQPPEIWSDALCQALNLSLDSDLPTAVLWGPDFVQYYNDAYIGIIEERHPGFLGRTFAQNMPEIWEVVHGAFEAVLESGRAASANDHLLCIERRGGIDEGFFTYSMLPVRDRDGAVGGMLVAVTETTRENLARRRTATLQAIANACEPLGSTAEISERVLGAIAQNPHDIPCAAVYSVPINPDDVSLLASSGMGPATPTWPFQQAIAAGTLLFDDLSPDFPQLVAGPWPDPIRQALLIRLPLAEDEAGAGMLVLGISPRLALDEDYRDFVQRIANHLSAGILTAQILATERGRTANLRLALTSNRRIGAAIGVLMALHKLSEEEAFDALRRASQSTRSKLRDVAEEVIRTGVLPG